MAEVELDPRWEWCDVRTISDPAPVWIKAGCRHTEVIPIESLDGETVAQLCLTCDHQFPPPQGWTP